MVDVLTAGHVNWDVTLRVDRIPGPDDEAAIRSQQRSGGGSAANVSVACARLGLSAGLIASIGNDSAGTLARNELADAGVDLTGLREIQGRETAIKYLLVDEVGEVAVLGTEGVNEAIGPDDVDPATVCSAGHLHLTSQRPETAATLAELATEHDLGVSFDPGRRLTDRDYDGALALADTVFVNDRESTAVLEGDHPAPDFADRTVVVKHGAGGATVHTPDGTYSHPGFSVAVTDTSGAGDAFAAGYLAVRLEGGSTERALEFGNACGALTSAGRGSRTAPSRPEVESFLAEQF
jgi:ribokinase